MSGVQSGIYTGVGTVKPEIEEAMAVVRANIRRIRKERGMSALAVSERVGISRPFYTQLETGSRRLSLRYLIGIAWALGVKPEDIF